MFKVTCQKCNTDNNIKLQKYEIGSCKFTFKCFCGNDFSLDIVDIDALEMKHKLNITKIIKIFTLDEINKLLINIANDFIFGCCDLYHTYRENIGDSLYIYNCPYCDNTLDLTDTCRSFEHTGDIYNTLFCSKCTGTFSVESTFEAIKYPVLPLSTIPEIDSCNNDSTLIKPVIEEACFYNGDKLLNTSTLT
jgi:hypothetical protein